MSFEMRAERISCACARHVTLDWISATLNHVKQRLQQPLKEECTRQSSHY